MSDSVGIPQGRNYYRRVFTPWDFTTGRTYQVVPEKGHPVVGISLGSADQSGGVRIQTDDIDGAFSNPVVVDPVSPLTAVLTKPFNVLPIIPTAITSGPLSTLQHNLELLIWYATPCFTRRGVYYAAGTVAAGAGSTAIATNTAWVSGRKRITCTLYNGTGATISSASVHAVVPLGASSGQVELFRVALASNVGFSLELNSALLSAQAPVTVQTTANYPTQMFGVCFGNTDGAHGPLTWSVEARDY